MDIDLELYRHSLVVSTDPLVRLSVIDIAPDNPERTMVFIHGFAGHARQWGYQLQAFSKKNRVIAIDERGHGQSDKPRGKYLMETVLSDLESAIDALGISEPFVLVGHSFGGAVITEYAHKYPEKISHLIMIASAGEYKINPGFRFGLKLPMLVLRLVQPFMNNWLSSPLYVLKPLHENNMAKWNGWQMFRELTVPTQVIRGHKDIVFTQAVFEEVAHTIPGAEDVDVGAAQHMVMLERRDAVNRAIDRFTDKNPRTWRDTTPEGEDSAQKKLQNERRWLQHYDKGVPYTVGLPSVPIQQLLRSAVRRFPLHPALIFEGNRMTYRRLNHEVNRFANALRSLGVNQGDRVMLLLPNIPQTVIGFFGVLKAGAVVVFTPVQTSTEEIVRQIIDSGVKVLFTLNQFSDQALAIKQAAGSIVGGPLEHIFFTSAIRYIPPHKYFAAYFDRERRIKHKLPVPNERGIHQFSKTIYGQPNKSPQINVDPKDPAAIIYTGGTTGEPKGVVLSHQNMVANALQTRHWMPDAKEGKERFLCVLPYTHMYGLTTALTIPISLGATLILKATFEIEDLLKTIKNAKPTMFPGVPQMYVAINNFPGVRRFGVSSINYCLSGSTPLPVEVAEQFEKLTKGKIVEGYGLTEAGPVTHANPFEGTRKVGSIGIPIPSTEAKIFDLPTGKKEVAQGQIGELAVRGPQIMIGYWNDEEATRLAINKDGWLLTGDVAQMDEDGYFRIIARKADMWYPEKGDQPAFPRDVEEVLYEIPQVKEVTVVAIAGQPFAFVITQKKRPEAKDLIAYCKRRLPPELVPRLIVFLDDFPRSFIGKVLRRELARRYEENHAESDT